MTHKELSKNYPSIFTAVHYDRKITVELERSDLDLDEVMDVFETLLVGMGFHKDGIKNWILDRADEYREEDDANVEPVYDGAGFTFEDNFRSHFVSNEEADEDYRSTLGQDSQRYEDGLVSVTQAILDYVDNRRGAVSYNELHAYYKIHSGSNSFSHILANLRIPYKNRKTQRYLAKEGKPYSDAKYVVKLANPSNWVVNDSDYRTFNEAPYGND